ncbi:MAG TPA: hypothetical protein PK230_07550 [Chitinophagales bacterium]|nr:hypothetical protein [Chitinophagales bacterium]
MKKKASKRATVADLSSIYDKAIKETIEKAGLGILQKLCNLPIVSLENLPNKLQKTVEREPDFLKIAQIADSNEKFIIHIEYQTNNDPSMAMRMLLYYALLRNIHKMPVKQYVIYLGGENVTMPTQLDENCLRFNYTLIDLHHLDYETFFASTTPEEVVLSILCNFGKETPQKIVERIYERLEKLVPDKLPLQGYMRQLSVFAILRQLQKEIYQKITDMPILIDYTLDPFFQKGFNLSHEEAQAIIAWKNKSLEEKDEQLQEQGELLQEKDEQLQEKNQLAAYLAHSLGMSNEAIAQKLNIEVDEIPKLIAEYIAKNPRN